MGIRELKRIPEKTQLLKSTEKNKAYNLWEPIQVSPWYIEDVRGRTKLIIQYSFFGVKESLGSMPSWLLWLRYSTFLLLYPTGITSEVGLIYISLPYIQNSEKFCVRMPNKLNFSFDYFYAAILMLRVYVPGSPHMYSYILGLRKKALAKSKRE